MQSAEVELKFPVSNIAALEAKLPALGFTLQTPRTFEHNTLYDTPARTLRDQHQILRLRKYGDTFVVTHKRLPDTVDDSHYKTRIETETAVAEGDALAEIFTQLGLQPAFVYEKFRSEWSMPAATPGEPARHLVIDETPIGTWAELEGPTAWIDSMLDQLSIPPSTCVTDSYGKLFLSWREHTGSPAENLTFAEIQQAASTR